MVNQYCSSNNGLAYAKLLFVQFFDISSVCKCILPVAEGRQTALNRHNIIFALKTSRKVDIELATCSRSSSVAWASLGVAMPLREVGYFIPCGCMAPTGKSAYSRGWRIAPRTPDIYGE